MSDWCAGCGRIAARRNMKFVAGWRYRCNHCRHVPAVPAEPDRSWVEFTGPTMKWPRLAAQVAAVAVCMWVAVDTTWELKQREHQRDHIAELRQRADRDDWQAQHDQKFLESQLPQIPYPLPGATDVTMTDYPPEPNGVHYHCEQGLAPGAMQIGSSAVGACSWRWPDGTVAPSPLLPVDTHTEKGHHHG